jgi:hypothetical protein
VRHDHRSDFPPEGRAWNLCLQMPTMGFESNGPCTLSLRFALSEFLAMVQFIDVKSRCRMEP